MKEFFDFVMQNQEGFITVAAIMVSTIIVFMGILKAVLFKRIPNKAVRCVTMSFTSIALMFGAVAILFAIKEIDWNYYVAMASTYSALMIVMYWFYENTQARAGIHKIGSFVLSKISNAIVNKVNGVAKSTEVIGNAIDDILKGASKIDKDMDELKKL